MAIALIVWLATAKGLGGSITVLTLSDQWVSFAGNAAAIISGGILSIGLSLWRPANFDWEKTRSMSSVKEFLDDSSSSDIDSINESTTDEKPSKLAADAKVTSPADLGEAFESAATADGLDVKALERTFKKYGWIFAALALTITIVSLLLEPLPVYRSILTYASYRLYQYL